MNVFKYKLAVALTLIVIITLGLITNLVNSHKQLTANPIPVIQGKYLLTAVKLPAFTLLDQFSRPFKNQDLQGRWHLVSYGYLNCPDICPTTLLTLKNFKDQLNAKTAKQRPAIVMPEIVFYSIDPARDRPVKLASYLNYFDQQFIGLTANQIESERLIEQTNFADSLGITATISHDQIILNKIPTKIINISHDAMLFLINPDGDLQVVLKPRVDADNIPYFNVADLLRDYQLSVQYYDSSTP